MLVFAVINWFEYNKKKLVFIPSKTDISLINKSLTEKKNIDIEFLVLNLPLADVNVKVFIRF